MIKISDIEYFSNDRTIRFLNMDCNVFMAGCKENEFDLNLSDPPYFNGPNKLGYYGAVKSKTKVKRQSYNVIGVWNVPNQIEFNEYKRVSVNQIIWGINYYDIENIGHGRIIWDKKNDSSTFSDGEIAYCSYIETVKFYRYMWNGMLQENMKDKQIKIHPTEKPIDLYKWIIDTYTKPTDTILDCFGGSMSNAIACHMKRRKLTIIELDVDYFKSALSRFETYEMQVEDIKEFGYAKTKLNSVNPTLF